MRKEWILILVLVLGIGFAYQHKMKQRQTQVPPAQVPPVPTLPVQPPTNPTPPQPPSRPPVVVDIINWPAVRQVSPDGIGSVLADIDSHMPAGHQYRAANKITWAHETTHGINANIRNKHFQSGRKVNAFYVLQNRAIVVEEPKTTIAAVANNVPQSWKGTCYQLYLVQQRSGWNNEPLYLCDEWVAYTNGAACRKDLNMEDGASEMEFTCEFTGYVLSLTYTIKQNCPNYDDKQFKAFVMWSVERTMQIYNNESGANTRLTAIRTAPDGETIRQFARSYFGTDWCKEVLGF
jgi:hypothetical protein